MLISAFLLTVIPAVEAQGSESLLAAVPKDARSLVHCRDVAGLRGRAERNDWYRLMGTAHGEPLLEQMIRDFSAETHSDANALLPIANALEGEVVLFDTGAVVGFVTEPPANAETLVGLLREWMPDGDAASHRTLDVAGASVELVAWPEEINGWSGRSGHFAAFVEHPLALAVYSGDSAEAVIAALTGGLENLGSERLSPLVSAYLDAGGGTAGGVELYVDFSPFIDDAEAAMRQAVEGFLPDPTRLLGLERGTWLHATADVFPGTRVDCRANLHIPAGTLAARLADTFKPLPHSLPSNLPSGVWGLWALHWDVRAFYERVRAAYVEAERTEGFETLDAGIEAARGAAGVDPIVDVLNQLKGDFAAYFVEPAPLAPDADARGAASDGMAELLMLGFHAGLVDGEAFQTAFENVTQIGGLESVFDLEEIAGVDAYLIRDADEIDGGLAFLPGAFTIAPSRRVLDRALLALTRADDASLVDGSRMQATIDENSAACFMTCVELTPLQGLVLPELDGDLRLPALEEGQPARNPFDSQLVMTAERTRGGFALRLHTR